MKRATTCRMCSAACSPSTSRFSWPPYKDKYFTSASTTPARIFPILGDLAAKHMRKAWKSKGLKVKLDKALGELTGRVGDRYPSRLSLEERGAFQLGYYFENQKRFDKTNKNNNEQGENND